jgi:small-conductance mechanosensitive channel
MRKIQKIAAAALLVLTLAAIYGIWSTQGVAKKEPANQKKLEQPEAITVDQSGLKTAQELAQQATTNEERPLAQEALRLADYDVDIAFENAIRRARLHPPPLTAEAKECKEREHKAEAVLQFEQEQAKQLSEALTKAPQEKKELVQGDLIQAEADLELAQDEVNDAKHDLDRAGGDPVGQVQALKQQHEQAAHGTGSGVPTGAEPPDQVGLVHRVMQWRTWHQKQLQLWQAKSAAEAGLAELIAKHDALDAQIDAQEAALPHLAKHSKKHKTATATANSAGLPPASGTAAAATPDSASLLQKTQELSENQKMLSAYDERIDTKKELADVYRQWIEVVKLRQRMVVHRALIGMAIILVIALIALFFSSWLDSLVEKLSMDRRQLESLRTVVRVGSQILALFLIALVIMGPPGQLGTFLGLAGAGLTVALKDFIVGFVGWFVLMGKNGMRLGDWVEINGVTGEVVQIGPIHTVLLETGNWTDSGHPTGRRVTFTNSFAIEGHYFNFSTTGQWLWDEIQVVLPPGQDPFPVIDAIHKKVTALTAESAHQAEQEWKDAAGSRELAAISMTPVLDIRPVVGGTEVSVRYITRASERTGLRTKLNQAAVELLGGRAAPPGG